ncbi:MAG TPA: class I SAM-dependent methyltransferase [Bryobacteraceae bacterium]|jgi:ubiquinone/menaquinone biosynthesis C-methylase UbiE|nr:class I SAM-dependent methyltransferase [Bryobacteraceae bacterium]
MEAITKPYKGMGMNGATARWYAGLTRKSMGDFRILARRIAAEIPPGASVLEVAPGPGYFAVELAKLGDYRVTGLDISPTFVEIARRNAAEAKVKVDFQKGNASRMPFADAKFDYVVCRAAFKNFTEPVAAMHEMYRVLKPGGSALIIDLRRDASPQDINKASCAMKSGFVNRMITNLTFRFMLLKRAYTKPEFEQMAGQTKFRSAEIRQDAIGLEVLLKRPLPET